MVPEARQWHQCHRPHLQRVLQAPALAQTLRARVVAVQVQTPQTRALPAQTHQAQTLQVQTLQVQTLQVQTPAQIQPQQQQTQHKRFEKRTELNKLFLIVQYVVVPVYLCIHIYLFKSLEKRKCF